MIEEDHDAKEPVNHVRLSESTRQFVVDDCVYCGETHYHGAADPVVATGGRTHRVAHCADMTFGGYYLELADDADPPRFYYERIGAEPPAAANGGEGV